MSASPGRVHPIAFPAAAAVAGALAGTRTGGPWWAFVLAGVGMAAAGMAWRRGRVGVVWIGLAVGVVAMGLGAREAGRVKLLEPLARLSNCCWHEIVGVVHEGPLPMRWGWRWVVQVRKVDGAPVRGGVVVSGGRGRWVGVAGDVVRIRARLKPIVSMANPGGFDYAQFMRRQGLVARAYLGRGARVELLGREGGLGAWAGRMRWKVGEWISRAGEGDGLGLVKAVVVGWRGAMGPEVLKAFRRSGTAHLLAISGLHLGMVWALGYMLVRLGLGWVAVLVPGVEMRRWAAVGGLVLAGCYALLSGAATPTIRALVMISALTLGLILARPYEPWGGLGLAAIVIALVWPWALERVSLMLSMTAVGAVLVVGRWLRRWARGRWRRAAARGLGWAVVGLGVGLALMPLQMHYFHELSLIGPAANLVVVPLVAGVVLPLGLGGVGMGVVWEAGGLWLVRLAGLAGEAAVEVVRWLGDRRWAAVAVASPGGVAVVCGYAAAVAFAAGARRVAAAAGVVAVVAGVVHLLPAPADGLLRVWVADVGQGMGCVARLPGGKVMVVDGGGGPGRGVDVGRLAMAPLMWKAGIRRVWAVACTHPHPDHCSGLAFIVRAFSPLQLWTNAAPARAGPYGQLLEAAAERGVRVLSPPELPRVQQVGRAKVMVLWPPGPLGGPEHDRCLWIGLGMGRCWIWMAGDASAREERAVSDMLPAGEHVLIAPHHGARTSLTPRLLRAMAPRHIVFSSGCCNRFGMPAAEAVARARAGGAKVWFTSTQGCISLVTDGSRWRLSPYLNPPRRCGPAPARCGSPWPAVPASSPPRS